MPLDVTAVTPDVSYTATASQTVFSVPFGFLADAHLVLTDNAVTVSLTTDYTVTGAGVTGGGSVTFVTGRTAGHTIRIYRVTPRSRSSAYTPNGALPATSLELDLDTALLIIQELEAGTIVVSDVLATFTSTGTFTLGPSSWTGFTTGLNVTFGYSKTGTLVSLYIASAATATDTSNSTAFTAIAGSIPAALRPLVARRVPLATTVGSGALRVAAALIDPNGSITFESMAPSVGPPAWVNLAAWQNDGLAKGLGASCVITYPI